MESSPSQKPHWGWEYKSIQTSGIGAQIARIAGGDIEAAHQIDHTLGGCGSPEMDNKDPDYKVKCPCRAFG